MIRNLILSALLWSATAHASLLLFEATYTQTSGTIQSFSTSFISTTFLGATGVETSLTPSLITDGTTDWYITKYRAFNIQGPECYLFGTASVSLFGCGSNSVTSPDGAFYMGFGFYPFSLGTFTPDVWGGRFLGGAGGSISSSTGTMTLTISDVSASVPEPDSGILLCAGLAILGWRVHKRFELKG